MPDTKSTTSEPITLIVPFGTKRAGRVILPVETAIWLRDQLIIALGKPDPAPCIARPKRRVRLHRGQWIGRA
jgi:hypothetical protein